MIDRTAENQVGVREFLERELGCEFEPRDTRDLSGLYFKPANSDFGQLHLGENLLADSEPSQLLERLTSEIIEHLRCGGSVKLMTESTEIIPAA